MINLLNFNTKSLLRSNKSVRNSLPYADAAKVGIVFTVEDKQKHEQVKDLKKKLERDGKNVTVVCFLPRDKQNYEFLFDFFTDKDVSFLGKITNLSALKFALTPFDYLFYLDREPTPLILNLLARSKAQCRLGPYWDGGKDYLEFMLQSRTDTKDLIDGIYKYSSLLK